MHSSDYVQRSATRQNGRCCFLLNCTVRWHVTGHVLGTVDSLKIKYLETPAMHFQTVWRCDKQQVAADLIGYSSSANFLKVNIIKSPILPSGTFTLNELRHKVCYRRQRTHTVLTAWEQHINFICLHFWNAETFKNVVGRWLAIFIWSLFRCCLHKSFDEGFELRHSKFVYSHYRMRSSFAIGQLEATKLLDFLFAYRPSFVSCHDALLFSIFCLCSLIFDIQSI